MEFSHDSEPSIVSHQTLRLERLFLSPYCMQVGIEMPDDPRKTMELFDGCRADMETLFTMEEGRLALASALRQNWGVDEHNMPQLRYASPAGIVLSERIKTFLEAPDEFMNTAIDVIAYEQQTKRTGVVSSLKQIWRRLGALHAQREASEEPRATLVDYIKAEMAGKTAMMYGGMVLTPEIEREAPKSALEKMLDHLNETEQLIIVKLYGLDSGATHNYEQIGRILSKNPRDVRGIAGRAVRKLKQYTGDVADLEAWIASRQRVSE